MANSIGPINDAKGSIGWDLDDLFDTYQTAGSVYATNSVYAITAFTVVLAIFLTQIHPGPQVLARIFSLIAGSSQGHIAGCKRIGIQAPESNLIHDQLDEKYRAGDTDGDGKTWKVKSLWVYPIKSCGGVELNESVVEKTGLRYDRMFSFATKEKGVWTFATQRTLPLLANVHTEVWQPDPQAPAYSKSLPAVQTNGVVRLVFPKPSPSWLECTVASIMGYPQGPQITIDLPLQPTPEQIAKDYTLEAFCIWKEQIHGINMTCHIPSDLATYLRVKPGTEFALFRCHEMRQLYRDAPRISELGWQPIAGFNDAYPVNLLGLSSLQAVDALQQTTRESWLLRKSKDLGAPPRLDARRFRSNIITSGTPVFEEESWNYIHLEDEEFYVVARCVRCKLPNVDPETGVSNRNYPNVAIQAHRCVDKGAPKTGCLAVQLVPKRECGFVRVGDVISVKRRGELMYTPMGA